MSCRLCILSLSASGQPFLDQPLFMDNSALRPESILCFYC